MSEQVKMGLIIGAAIVGAMGMWLYFSPFQICVRERIAGFNGTEYAGTDKIKREAKQGCLRQLYGE